MTSQKIKSIQDKPILFVDLKTPYLTDSFDDVVRQCGIEHAIGEVVFSGQEVVTFSGVRRLTSPSGKVVGLTARGMSAERPGDCEVIPDLYIAGAVEAMEANVMHAMNDGLLVARFSIFYGGPSHYTGRLPHEAGYSFDIPKSVDSVKTFLTDDDCLEALASRNPSRIRESLAKLNMNLRNPIIATPHLEVALSRPKSDKVLELIYYD